MEGAEQSQPVTESKEEKFVRLATKRTQAALVKIRLLANLTGSSYRYTEEQGNKILSSLRQAVDELEGKFRKVRGQRMGEQPFSF